MRQSLSILWALLIPMALSQKQWKYDDDVFDNIFKNTTSKENNLATPIPIYEKVEENLKSCGLDRVCVPRFMCNDKAASSNGTAIINIRAEKLPDTCPYLEICCNIEKKSDTVIKPSVLPTTVSKVSHEICGYRNPYGVIFGISNALDNEAQFGEFPWMVAILHIQSESNINVFECGGSLITPSVVMTGAHCVKNKFTKDLIVRAGEWDAQTNAEVFPHQDRYVLESIIHEEFNADTLYNDVALLTLHKPFQLEDNVQPICLPDVGTSFDKSRCFATGWGKDKFGSEGQYQVILKKIELPIVPHGKCQGQLRRTILGNYFKLDESFICAGGEKNMDTCQGDGGSPLVCPIEGSPGRYYQAGIVAWGIGCGTENVPGVYANVAHLRQWIDQKLKAKNKFEINYFTVSKILGKS